MSKRQLETKRFEISPVLSSSDCSNKSLATLLHQTHLQISQAKPLHLCELRQQCKLCFLVFVRSGDRGERQEEASDSRDPGHRYRRHTSVSGHTWRHRALPNQVNWHSHSRITSGFYNLDPIFTLS